MQKEAIKEVDEIIKSVSEKIRNDRVLPGDYADTVKALAALVEARAKLDDKKIFEPECGNKLVKGDC